MHEQEIKIGGKYRHFKGNEYRVLGTALHSETQEEMVVYQALYDDGKMWVRPKLMFLDKVEKAEYTGPRFTYVAE